MKPKVVSFKNWQDEGVWVEELQERLIRSHDIKAIIRHILRNEERIRQMIFKMTGANKRPILLIFTAVIAILKELQKGGRL